MYKENRKSKNRLFITDLSKLEQYGFHSGNAKKRYYLKDSYINVNTETKQLSLNCSMIIDDLLVIIKMYNDGIIKVVDYEQAQRQKEIKKIKSKLKKFDNETRKLILEELSKNE